MRALFLLLLGASLAVAQRPNPLPARYYQLMEEGLARVEQRLAAEPSATLALIEAQPGWTHFPSAILAAAVLYTKSQSANTHRGDRHMLDLTLKIGDLLAKEQEAGTYNTRLDHHRDTYMWLEAYRLVEKELGDERRERWKRAILVDIVELADDTAKRQDYPLYQSPYIGTSPNHFSLWASTVYLAGRVFGNKEWEKLGAKVMHRFAAEEQSPDGFWGEHSSAGPTTGYDYLTSTAIAEYWEHSRDRAALEALHRSTDFHEYFTYPDGTPVETINDRNRYWDVSMWGHFGFSNFSDGRRYAQFLTDRYEKFSLESLGRIAQNALYFHDGSFAKIPQDRERSAHQMSVPAGIRKTGPWVVCLSGIIATTTPSQFYLDRQSNLSVFHEKLGLIITGANSKRQPELATVLEETAGEMYHMPMSSKLAMSDREDRLALSYRTFFSVLSVPTPASAQHMEFAFEITPRGRMAKARLTLQLVLYPGEDLEADGRTIRLDEQAREIEARSSIRHHGWTLKLEQPVLLKWPVRPFNPYRNAVEQGIEHAVGALATELEAKPHTVRFAIDAT